MKKILSIIFILICANYVFSCGYKKIADEWTVIQCDNINEECYGTYLASGNSYTQIGTVDSIFSEIKKLRKYIEGLEKQIEERNKLIDKLIDLVKSYQGD